MSLQVLDLVDAAAHLHDRDKRVSAVRILVSLTALEDVLNALERHTDSAHIPLVQQINVQQINQGRYAAGIHHELDLQVVAARSGVAKGPCTLLADAKVLRLEHVHENGDNVVVNDSLQLLLAAGGDMPVESPLVLNP